MAEGGPLRRWKDKVTASLGDRSPRPSSPSPPDRSSSSGPSDGGATGGVSISYAPDHDGDADPGEVVWTWVAFEDDPSQGKDRPVLVLGWDGPLLAAVPLSSKDHTQRHDAGEWVEVGRGAWDRENRVSYADAARLLRVDPSVVRREGAALDEAAFDRVVAHVSELHDWRR